MLPSTFSLTEKIYDFGLSDGDKAYANELLANWPALELNLRLYTDNQLAMCIIHEANVRCRIRVLKRLLGRYYKLCRERTTDFIITHMERRRLSEGARNRTIPGERSQEDRGPGL